MKLIFVLLVLALFLATAKATVGLHAPNRYDGLPESCLMPMDMGYCRARMMRYYFNISRMKCTMFFFGGCAGNQNNFKSMDDCIEVCEGVLPSRGNEITT